MEVRPVATGSRGPLPQDVGAILGAYAPILQPPVDTGSSPPTVEQTSTARRRPVLQGNPASRLGEALLNGVRSGLLPDSPLGPSRQTLQKGRDLGFFPRAGETRPLLPLMLNEAAFTAVSSGLDATGRAFNAAGLGVSDLVGQTVREFGGPEASARSAEREVNAAGILLPMILGGAPGASIGSMAGRARVAVRDRFPNSPPTPKAIPGRDPVLLPKGPVNARGRQQTSSLEEAKSVFSDVFDTQQSAVGKLFREDIGDITVDFGRMGIPEKKFKTGFGLAKIEAKRTSQGIDGEDFVRNVLPRVITQGKLHSMYTRGPSRRAEVRLGEDLAIFNLYRSLGRKGNRTVKRETWLLTGFRKLPDHKE